MSLPPREIWIVANTAWYVFNFRGNLIRQLGRRGYAVTILSPHDEYADRLRVLGARHIHLEMDNPGTNPLRDIGMIARLVSLFRKERPRILLTYTPKVNIYCAIAARLTGVPV